MAFQPSVFILALACLALPFSASAQATPEDHASELHHNHASFFIGATTPTGAKHVFSNSATWFTVGFDYEYRFNKPLGISFFTEYLFAVHEEFLFGLPVFVHPWRGLKLNAGPLMALVHEAESVEAPVKWHSKYGFRLEAGYDLHIDHYTITPIINYDRVDGHGEMNYGIAIGVGF